MQDAKLLIVRMSYVYYLTTSLCVTGEWHEENILNTKYVITSNSFMLESIVS